MLPLFVCRIETLNESPARGVVPVSLAFGVCRTRRRRFRVEGRMPTRAPCRQLESHELLERLHCCVALQSVALHVFGKTNMLSSAFRKDFPLYQKYTQLSFPRCRVVYAMSQESLFQHSFWHASTPAFPCLAVPSDYASLYTKSKLNLIFGAVGR